MNRFRGLSIALFIAFSAVLLTACDPGGVSPTPSSSPTEPTPTSTPVVDAATKPALEDLVLTTEGLGEVKLGIAPPADDPSVNIVTFDGGACAAEGLPGLWRATYPDIDLGFGPQPPFAISVTGDAVTRIDVNTSEIYTDTGIHLGSTLDELLAVYPGGPDVVVNHADVSDVYVILGTNGKLQFEVAVDRIAGYWDPSAVNTVVFLSAIDSFTEPYGIAASDNAIGYCSHA